MMLMSKALALMMLVFIGSTPYQIEYSVIIPIRINPPATSPERTSLVGFVIIGPITNELDDDQEDAQDRPEQQDDCSQLMKLA